MKVRIFKETIISVGYVILMAYIFNLTDYMNSGFSSEVLYPIVLSTFTLIPMIIIPALIVFFLLVWRLLKPIIENEVKYQKLYMKYSSSEGRMITFMIVFILGIITAY